jgi:CheY-like chemotaxis protein
MSAGRTYDLVILDLTIRGGMGGAEAMQKLLEIDPAVKAVVSSGYSDDVSVAEYREYGFRAVLKKPYVLGTLREVLNTLMGA